MDLEQRQVIRRSLDHHCQLRRRLGPCGPRALLHPEQGPQRGHVQPGAGPVGDRAEDPVHPRAGGEDQVPAVLGLVDRVVVAEPAGLLVGQVQPEAQARGVDPPVAGPAQPPYSRVLRQGLCDLGQAARIRDPSKAVPLLGESRSRPRARRQATYSWPLRMTCAPNGGCPDILIDQVPPLRVHDVEGVVVDVLGLLLQGHDAAARRPFHLPHRCPRPGDQDHEDTRPDGMAAPGTPPRSGACAARPCSRSPGRRSRPPRPAPAGRTGPAAASGARHRGPRPSRVMPRAATRPGTRLGYVPSGSTRSSTIRSTQS